MDISLIKYTVLGILHYHSKELYKEVFGDFPSLKFEQDLEQKSEKEENWSITLFNGEYPEIKFSLFSDIKERDLRLNCTYSRDLWLNCTYSFPHEKRTDSRGFATVLTMENGKDIETVGDIKDCVEHCLKRVKEIFEQ